MTAPHHALEHRDLRPVEAVRVTYSGPVLPFKVPEIPAWIAVLFMALVVVVMTVVASVAVLS